MPESCPQCGNQTSIKQDEFCSERQSQFDETQTHLPTTEARPVVTTQARRTLLKVATLASSILLVAGAVSYRAGALDWIIKQESPPKGTTFISSSKVIIIEPMATKTTETKPSSTSDPTKSPH